MEFNKNILIVTPILFGNGSGAATYYKILTRELKLKGHNITVITDREKPQSSSEKELNSRVKVLSIFPNRSLRHRNFVIDVFKYGVQNLQYFFIPFLLYRYKVDVVVVHSSFFNHVTSFSWIMKLIFILFSNLKVIFDVRDRGLNSGYLSTFRKVDKFVACSMNVFNYLKDIGVEEKKIVHIPVIQDIKKPAPSQCKKILLKYGLYGKDFILYAGLIKKEKRVDEILDAYIKFRDVKGNETLMVVAGLLKEGDSRIRNLLNSDGIQYLGNLEQVDLHCLMMNAKLCLNISRNEGLPRSSLEAIGLNANVVLPPEVPEFEQYCPSFVYKGNSAKELAIHLSKINTEDKCAYPIGQHSRRTVIPKYLEIL